MSDTSPLVAVAHRSSMRVLTLNRPHARNPLDGAMAGALHGELDAAFADDSVRSVAIAGSGSSFCAGGDLRQLRELSTRPVVEAYAWPAAIVELNKAMLDAPKPVVALVDGPAFAGGMGLAGMCDVVLATRRATFAMPEVRVGMFPMIIVAHLVRSLPRKKLLEMMFTGLPMAADEAHRLGFVGGLCENEDDLWTRADDYAAAFAQVSPTAVRLGRKAFGVLSELPAHQALDAAQFLNLAFFLGTDVAEGANAFLEGRPPPWQAGGAS